MKSLSTILILILFVHLLCSGSCLSQTVSTTEDAPCHERRDDPSNPSPQHSQESGDWCVQGQVTESKNGVNGKYVFQSSAVLSVTAMLPLLNNPFLDTPDLVRQSCMCVLSSTSSILRI